MSRAGNFAARPALLQIGSHLTQLHRLTHFRDRRERFP
jgi:hypothetical protein